MRAIPAESAKIPSGYKPKVERTARRNLDLLRAGEVHDLQGAGVPLGGHPRGHSHKPEPRRNESRPAPGKIINRLSAGEELNLSHPSHSELKSLQFAFEEKVFHLVPVQMRFKQLCWINLGATPVADHCLICPVVTINVRIFRCD